MSHSSLDFKTAVHHHQSGRIDQAADTCRRILQTEPTDAEVWHLYGLICWQMGQGQKAVDLLGKAIESNPAKSVYHNSLGLVYVSQNRHREAEGAFFKAAELDPGCVDAVYNRALTLSALGRTDEALVSYSLAVELKPDLAEAYFSLGNIFKQKGLIEKAIENYSRAVEVRPDFGEAYHNWGQALQGQGRLAQAVAKFQQAVRVNPGHADSHYSLGFALNEIGDPDNAAAHYRRAIELRPDYADAYHNLGAVLKTQGRLAEAISHYEKALEYSSDKAGIYNNLGNALEKCGRIDDALDMYHRALTEKPDFAGVYNNLGTAFNTLGDYPAAQQNYDRALELDPQFAEARFNRAVVDLLHGNFARGWRDYEWRLSKQHWQTIYPLRHDLPRWSGGPFPGKRLYVHDEQGLGDTIHFVRYLPRVKALGGTVRLGTRTPLLSCMQGLDGCDEVTDRTAGGDPAEGCDLVVPLLSLPGIFGTDLADIPADIPYIRADAAKMSLWRGRLNGPGFKVGLVWAGNPDHEKDHVRSIPLKDLIGLAEIPGIRLFGLQKGTAAAQMAQIPVNAEMKNLGTELEDFSDTAALMASMDLIISVDTAAAHLAGAMGLPVWTMVYYAPDWRWMLDREDSPWYPTMRLFRQQKRNDWTAVIDRVAAELKRLTATTGTGPGMGADACFEHASRHYQAGRPDRALELLQRILDQDPQHSGALHLLGVAAHHKGDYDKALALIGRALAIDPQAPHYYYNFGLVCAALGNPQAAINAYRRAIDLKADYIEAYGSLANALKDQGRNDEALDLLDRVLQIVPDEAKIHHSRGQILSARGQHAHAVRAFKRAIDLDPGQAGFYNSLGITRCLSGDLTGAKKAFEQALNRRCDYVEAINNLGTAAQEAGDYNQALAHFEQALAIRPDYGDARFNRAAIQLLKGRLDAGWPDYEYRLQKAGNRRHHACPSPMPTWDGAPFSGRRLLVHCEQGLGDALQFVRYLPLVKQRGGIVILEANPCFKTLFSALAGVDRIVAPGSDPAAVEHDVCIPLLSLPGIFKTTLETVPAEVPYIYADSKKTAIWAEKFSVLDMNVGIVWAGNPSHRRDHIRSLDLESFELLAEIPNARFFSLQKGPPALQTQRVTHPLSIQNLCDALADFSDTAAVIANLDLVISADTAVAHLAGAMGKATWVLLPFVPDWRWMLDREDSPWYPTMRLFRQPDPGNWTAVMRRVADELKALAGPRSAGMNNESC